MCGVAGLVRFERAAEPASLKLATDKLAHRGPDGEGIWLSACGRVALGHRRLSVIDLTNNSQQPMTSTTVCIFPRCNIAAQRSLRGGISSG